MTVSAKKETHEFQTEVTQLLDLMIHSLYSNKEIFLRELISNASDAADKLRFEGLSNDALFENDSELKIRVSYDIEARTVTVSDNGIGMTRDETIEHLGTIAKSGTKAFFNSLTGDQAKDAHLIGQFGVGFYSAFIVADKVTVRSRKAGAASSDGVEWVSGGKGDFSVENIEKEARGTEVTLHLREDQDEFLDDWRLRNVIKKYSDHISLPIIMKSIPAPAEEGEEPEEPVDETVNSASALWTRAKKDISEEEYNEFYQHVSHDFEAPLAHIHNHVEGTQSYISLLYIPKNPPFDLYDRESKHGLKLYVKRVFIMDEADKLLPRYLRFVKGVIDSDDLPLNVSREILQHNKVIDKIRGGSVKKILDMLQKMSEKEPEKYQEFWKAFGRVLKEGPGEDFANKEKIAKLFRFASTHTSTDEQNVSFDDYISRMKEGQDKIYYIVADSFAAAKNSPHLEVFAKKGLEVLLLSDPVDEWLASHVTEFDGKQLQAVSKGALDLGDFDDEKEKEELKKNETELKGLLDKMKETLDEKVKEVRLTNRLTDSPSCLVVEEHEMAVNIQRMLKSAGHAMPQGKPILEINPEHALVKRMNDNLGADAFADLAHVLFDQALLVEGGQIDDPNEFVRRMNSLLAKA
ncbi:MAG: molecular chaperone HtpG [Gammaproteobacteria bacterium]|nr:MAG: molecular chaperone HtpG [Gammaproteobacteria bacterium]